MGLNNTSTPITNNPSIPIPLPGMLPFEMAMDTDAIVANAYDDLVLYGFSCNFYTSLFISFTGMTKGTRSKSVNYPKRENKLC